MSKSYFKGTNHVIIPFNKVTSTIEDSSKDVFRLYVCTAGDNSRLVLGHKDGPRFLEEYTAWLDSQEQSLI